MHIFIRQKNEYFVFKFLCSKCPKLLLNAHFGPQIHALDSILPTVNIESGLKGFSQYVGVNIQSGINPSDKIDILDNPKTVFFFQSRGYFTNERDRFLIFNRKTYKNDTLTTSKPSLCCAASFKVHLSPPPPPPPLQKLVSDRFQLMCTKLDLIFILWTFST